MIGFPLLGTAFGVQHTVSQICIAHGQELSDNSLHQQDMPESLNPEIEDTPLVSPLIELAYNYSYSEVEVYL